MSGFNEAKNEILKLILELGEATSGDIAEFTNRSMENASMLMLLYHRWGLLSRYRTSKGFVYAVTDRGIERLAWLQN
jgi:hypothetical protein